MPTETITLDIDAALAARLRARGQDPAAIARAALEGAGRAGAGRSALSDVEIQTWKDAHREELARHAADLETRDTFGAESRSW
jgi:hypothetical protein